MKAIICLVMLILGSVSTDMAEECDLATFYLELGCKPELPSTYGSCPASSICPDLNPDPSQCYYRGVSYKDKDLIPQNLIRDLCSLACSCNVYNGEPQISCAIVDCFEAAYSELHQQCVDIYKLGVCCSTGFVCGKDAIANLKSCEVDGKMYREGEVFRPLNSNKVCICTASWNSSIENPQNCRDFNCGIEVHYLYDIQKSCAPVFASDMRSCPISFECPTSTSKVIRGLNIKNLSAQCTFGNMTLSIGDEVSVADDCTKCICSVPPFVTCVNFCVPSTQ